MPCFRPLLLLLLVPALLHAENWPQWRGPRMDGTSLDQGFPAKIEEQTMTWRTELPGTVVRLMDKGVVVDIGNDIEGFVPLSHLSVSGKNVDSPAEVAWEQQKMNVRVLEVDPIHRRIVLGVVDIPEGQERPAEPSKVHTEDEVAAVPPVDMSAVIDDE